MNSLRGPSNQQPLGGSSRHCMLYIEDLSRGLERFGPVPAWFECPIAQHQTEVVHGSRRSPARSQGSVSTCGNMGGDCIWYFLSEPELGDRPSGIAEVLPLSQASLGDSRPWFYGKVGAGHSLTRKCSRIGWEKHSLDHNQVLTTVNKPGSSQFSFDPVSKCYFAGVDTEPRRLSALTKIRQVKRRHPEVELIDFSHSILLFRKKEN